LAKHTDTNNHNAKFVIICNRIVLKIIFFLLLGNGTGIILKEEPPADLLPCPADIPIATHNVTADDEIVLNISSADEVVESIIKSEPVDVEEADPELPEQPAFIVPWPAFVPLASHPELAVQRRKRKSAVKAGAVNSPVIASGEKRSRSRLEDVTALYSEEDADENQVNARAT
jgi:hypothetical protein